MDLRVGIIGLGYVGLPLAIASAKKFKTTGFDINKQRINELKHGSDKTFEVSAEELQEASSLTFTNDPDDLQNCNFFIVTVPTPIDENKNPDLGPLQNASKTVGRILSKGDVVVYESTVYPGCTEEVCVPILEASSNLKFNLDFYVGYSPERINPGDRLHRVYDIQKVTSGSNKKTALTVDQFYQSIIPAGTHLATSIKVAEAAKVIENSQRDINIAFVNELALIFNKLGIDTEEVLEAAGTKWNFLPFKPGLVGGHCIGVDPYYLTQKAESVGYHPQVILSGRRINDNMGQYVASEVIKLLMSKHLLDQSTRVLILGLTFKENCPDIRNTRVIDIYKEFLDFGLKTEVYDPYADPEEVRDTLDIELVENFTSENYSAIVLAVAHEQFLQINWSQVIEEVPVIYDVKSFLPREFVTSRL